MLINPEKHFGYKWFFDNLFYKIRFFKRQKCAEYRSSVVLDYLLLKSLGDNILRSFLRNQIPDIVDYYMPIIPFQLKDTRFSQNNLVSPHILRNSLYTMRTDADLKIYFSLFGGSFQAQEQETADGTGGLYFTKNDFKDGKAGYKAKIRIMKEHLKGEESSKIPCIALNVGHHWVAIQGIKDSDNVLIINNPLGGRQQRRITRSTPEHHRFYLFHHDPMNAFVLSKSVEGFLSSEIAREKDLFG